MTSADMDIPAAGLAPLPRPEPFRRATLVPMDDEQNTAGSFFDAIVPVLDATGAP
ncbi:MAG: hypothetical protein IID49_14055 [Proteobacteria bacterium]|nr:hypothetical protein [Pseudomonadota bacterium]MCH8953225.1 hypothetical protein [Pseudomonadota bacterium]